jgi:uncharacterized protein (TIGR03790 family)
MFRIFVSMTALLVLPISIYGLEPKEVFLLVNKNEAASQEIAEYYCKKRNVPLENILSLDLPKVEDISRTEYQTKMISPIRAALKTQKDQAKVLLSIYGVPLRVGGSSPSDKEKEELKEVDADIKKLDDEKKLLEEERKKLEAKTKDKKEDPSRIKEIQDRLTKIQKERDSLQNKKMLLSHTQSQASVDSELMLLWWDDYQLVRWQLNLHYFQIPEGEKKGKPPVLMTCRLDGPTPKLVKRLIDDAVETEAKGLEGKVYVDARGIKYDPKTEPSGTGYGGYDESFREMATLLEKEGKLTVVLDDKEPVFKEGSCPDCALYCGWYSHGKFVDCCKFNRGAVAWHLASSEAISLRKESTLWCRNLLDKGACATLGPVAEPYTIGFPKPEEFFGFLATGKYSLVESYSKSILFASWMTVLIGDPLYKPFAKNPCLKEEQVFPSPKGSITFGKEK